MTLMVGKHRITTIPCGEPWNENCYLVHDISSGEGALIDPGGLAELIIRSVEESGVQLRYILLTHAHHDHVGAVTAVCQRFELPCWLQEGDARLLRHAPMYALRFAGKKIEPPEPVEIYEDQPSFELGAQSIEILHTPGHTAGSVCIAFGDFIFTGDTLLYQHIGRTDLPGGDAVQLAVSVGQLVKNLLAEIILFPGHGRRWTIGEARAWWQNHSTVPPQLTEFGA